MSKSDDLVEKMYDKLEVVANDIGDIKVTIAKQEENIKLHIYRTELAEQSIELLQNRLEPIENHVKYVHGVLKFFGAFSILVGATLAIVQIVRG